MTPEEFQTRLEEIPEDPDNLEAVFVAQIELIIENFKDKLDENHSPAPQVHTEPE